MSSPRLDIDRASLSELFAPAMEGRGVLDEGLPFKGGRGSAKTYAVEANIPEDSDDPLDYLRFLGDSSGLMLGLTGDDALAVLYNDRVAFFVDVLDPRFWLVHTASAAGHVGSWLGKLVRSDRRLDRCWFPRELLREVQAFGKAHWFKADFQGDELLPPEGVADRRLRVQLEGDQPEALLEILWGLPQYRTATALSSIATRHGDGDQGFVDEIAHYRGSFVTRGSSFDLHVGFVGRVMQRYREVVEGAERDFRLRWSGDDGEGFMVDGDVLVFHLGREIPDLDRFLSGLFSCREPFRLWAVPRRVDEHFATAEVVDLHVGERFRMDITPRLVRVYLSELACGNTVLRLLTNIQHRYDATAVPSNPAALAMPSA